MAKNEIVRIGPLILIILHHHFAAKQFGHGHLGQLYASEITYVVLTRIHLLFVFILTWPRTELSRNTLLNLYSLVWGQNIVKFWGEIILKGLSHQNCEPPNYSNFLIWEAI